MTQTTTPRTDEFYSKLYAAVSEEMTETVAGQERDFARQLERELSAAKREALESAKKITDDRYELRLCEDSATSSVTDDYLLGYEDACVTIADRIAQAIRELGEGG